MPEENTRLQTIAFFGTVPASTNKTLVSHRIEVPFKIKEIAASFASGTNRLLNLEFYVSPDDSEPTSKPLTGLNILASLGHVGYLTGNDERKQMKVETMPSNAGQFLKIYANNNDAYDHTIDAQITIELIY